MAGRALIYIQDTAANACQDTMASIARLFKMVALAIHVKMEPNVVHWARTSNAHAKMDTLVNNVRLISMIVQHSLVEMGQHVLIKLVVIPVNVPETLVEKHAKTVSNINVQEEQ